MTKIEQLRQERQEALDKLHEILKPGDTVQTILRHVSRSGMMRHISLRKEGWGDITWLAATALGYRRDDRNGGIKVGGCGMDMGFHLVYCLGRYMWPVGFVCAGPRTDTFRGCCSNDHSNRDGNYTPHMHRDGGYALRQEWI
jgi:hypothetical protein